MAAEMAPRPAGLPLLLPPDRPPTTARRSFGWRWKDGSPRPVLERRPQDDEQGAIVQWIVLRYYRDGAGRGELAREYGYSARHVQTYLTGDRGVAHRQSQWHHAYAAPVIRALAGLGFIVDRRHNRRQVREGEIATARAFVQQAAMLLAHDTRPAARELVHAAALLTAEVPS